MPRPDCGVDVIVRGEGELTFRELLRALERGASLASIPGLSWRAAARPRHPQPGSAGQPSAAGRARAAEAQRPRAGRGTRCSAGQVDVIETSRGCTFDCSFCSIIEMRGRNFHTFDFARVLADIADAKAHGARAIFLVDDNITLDVSEVPGALPGHRRRGPERSRLPRAGHDVGRSRSTARRWRR